MSEEADAEFERKIQRLRYTGVGGVSINNGDTGSNLKTRKGDPAVVQMKVIKGVVVANPVSKNKNAKPIEKSEGSIKVFATKDMETNPIAENKNDTEESVINEILKLQKKLAQLKSQ